MRTINRFLIHLGGGTLGADALLAWLGQEDLSVYFIVNAIIFFITALAHTNLKPESRAALGKMASIIFAGFAVALVIKIAGS